MSSALIGYSGFVGSSLLKQRRFDPVYRSTTISEITGNSFDLVVCAGAPAQKWIANLDPAADRLNIQCLMDHIKTIRCKQFVLISTVDVFSHPAGVDEDHQVDEASLHPYGLHRRLLEKLVQTQFEKHLVVRLPGLVGPGLRKNVLFDLLNENNLHAVDSRAVFQFYPMVNLWFDIETAITAQLKLVHLTAEPVSVAEVATRAFNKDFDQRLSKPPARYDFRSRCSALFGGTGDYQYSKRDTMLAIRAYAQSEPRTTDVAGEPAR